MNIPRRAVLGGLFVWTVAIAFTPIMRANKLAAARAAAPRRLSIIYVGARDCEACDDWNRSRRPAFKQSVIYDRVAFREILAPSLGEMFEDRVWADSDRALRNEIKRAGASAPCWVVLRDAQIVAIETGLGGWDSRVWPMLLRDA